MSLQRWLNDLIKYISNVYIVKRNKAVLRYSPANFYDIPLLKWKNTWQGYVYKPKTTRFLQRVLNSIPHSPTHYIPMWWQRSEGRRRRDYAYALGQANTHRQRIACLHAGYQHDEVYNAIQRKCAENVSKQVTARPRNNGVIGEVDVFSSFCTSIVQFYR